MINIRHHDAPGGKFSCMVPSRPCGLDGRAIMQARFAMQKNAVSHFEIYADDPGKLGQFYTSLFDWTLEPMPQMNYTVIRTVQTDPKGMPTQTGGINGGILNVPGYKPGAWVNYVNVDSIDASVEKAQKLGAKVTKPKSPVPGMGWFAMLTDPQGNAFAMFQSNAQAK